MNSIVELRPYTWEGPYAQWRADALHDPGLCADARAPWMPKGERLILRACEIIGVPEYYLYDDHTPPAEPRTRGGRYSHIPFQWDTSKAPRELSVDAETARRHRFALTLTGRKDYVDIQLTIANRSPEPLGPIDWAFCVIALEAPSLRDKEHTRTFVYDGKTLRSLAELKVGGGMTLIPVTGGNGFAPDVHSHLPRAAVHAKASVTILESPDGRHSAAIGFQQAYNCFGCTGNMCIHADPYFGVIPASQERHMHGRLYLMEGNRHAALDRYLHDFAQR